MWRRALLVSCVAIPLLMSACSAPDVPPADSESKSPTTGAGDALCAQHGAPSEQCFICDPGLREAGRLWCREHARYEDRCWECHPELEDKTRLWCKEHSLYEDECFLCHPELLEGSSKRDEAADAGLMCNEHGVLERECGICHPELLVAGSGLKVRLASAASAELAGVVVGTPEVDSVDDGVECLAELGFDQNRLARITPLVSGLIDRVAVDLGTRVARGDLLATITSATIGEAEGAYLRDLADERLHRKAYERIRELRAQGISSEMAYQAAEADHLASIAALRQARQRLQVFGFDDRAIERLPDREGALGVLELRAPFAGEIVERAAVQGSAVDPADVLFTVADPRALWAMLSIPESLLEAIRSGQAVRLEVDSLPGRTFDGTLTWISASVDAHTRMARGRVEVPNPDGRLKAEMFARARIVTTRAGRAVTVPRSAVQDVTGTPVVFVRSAADLFEARPVTLGIERDGRVEVARGLEPHDPIVVAGGFALKSRFLASRLGAGCVDD